MASDPYGAFARDIQARLRTARELESGAERDPSQYTDLRATLTTLRQDISDLRQTVRAVEQSGPARFGLDEKELALRRVFVDTSEREVARMERAFREQDTYADTQPSTSLAWEKEQQQRLLSGQNRALDTMGTSLHTLRSQAELIGTETGEQLGLLQDLDTRVEHTQSQLEQAVRRMDRFVARVDARMHGWCVWLLIAVLLLLLLALLLV
ncbi:hypothetical protein MVES_003297 [Malassezia vespertilionis]|uniref:t-SNARE coiled-coil homology domain-containing protein n=1 Tax=Malassezia vespertilionis TaxID=2020962 RepID=A0A2N1J8B7_9BASI|nr:hypothetical protein MVES_003297 [Malassezia vespertilionis]